MNGSSSVSGNSHRGINNFGTLTMSGTSAVFDNGNQATSLGGGIYSIGAVTLRDSSSVHDNTAITGGGIYNNVDGTVSGCDGTGVGEWVGTAEPNTPNDFLDGDVTLITCA